ncbi:hypothetical protein lerEdw1_019790 [Lerista edwardsae]|nr:hypothetical protein lerEdw1_019790 [Lerista edwardsae]
MAQAEDADMSGRTSPSPKYEDDKEMDKMYHAFKESGNLDPHHAVIHALPNPVVFTLRDIQQKVVYLRGKNLVAAAGAANVSPADIKVMPNMALWEQAHNPVFMGVGIRCLSCGTSEKPVLQLVDRDVQSVYNDKAPNLPFTFANLMTGSTHQFESLAYPGWFLCTSQGNNEPLSITNQPGGKQITSFYFQPKG